MIEREKIAEVAGVRSVKGWVNVVVIGVTAISIILTICFVFNISFLGIVIPLKGYLAALYALLLPLVFLLYPAHKGASLERVPWYDGIASILSFLPSVYVFINASKFSEEPWEVAPTTTILILGSILIILTLEAVRRTGGWVIFVLTGIICIYPLFAQHMPGFLVAKSYSFGRFVGFHYAGSESIFGIPIDAFGKIILGFLLFSVGLQVFGAADFLFKLAYATVGFVRGGPAKISVVSSGLFASMSGSAVANVAVDGGITIPMMASVGYPKHYAAAIEADASTGGVITPPVMGATAFIMAEFLGESYGTICIAAAIPAFLYYFSLFVQTDFFAAKKGLKGLPRRECPPLGKTLKEGWLYLLMVFLLIYLTMVINLERKVFFYTSLFLILIGIFRKESRISFKKLIDVCKKSAVSFAQLIGLFGGVGMIIGALTLTGAAHSLSSGLMGLAGGNLALILLLCALTSFILGMGMSITACYLILVILVAPAMINLGIKPIAAHLFVMYWGMVSYITPPVALAAYVAAGIAGESPWRVGWVAVRLGLSLLYLPFLFVTRPALVAIGSLSEIIINVMMVMWSLVLFSAFFEGYFPGLKGINMPFRVLLAVLGGLFLIPNVYINILAFGTSVMVIVIYFLQVRKSLFRSKAVITAHPE